MIVKGGLLFCNIKGQSLRSYLRRKFIDLRQTRTKMIIVQKMPSNYHTFHQLRITPLEIQRFLRTRYFSYLCN